MHPISRADRVCARVWSGFFLWTRSELHFVFHYIIMTWIIYFVLYSFFCHSYGPCRWNDQFREKEEIIWDISYFLLNHVASTYLCVFPGGGPGMFLWPRSPLYLGHRDPRCWTELHHDRDLLRTVCYGGRAVYCFWLLCEWTLSRQQVERISLATRHVDKPVQKIGPSDWLQRQTC